MAKLDSFFKKNKPSASEDKLKKLQNNLRKGSGIGIFEDKEKNVQFIKDEMQEMIKMFPDSPKFLGRAEYTIKKRPLSFISRRYPDISDLREIVNRFGNKGEIKDPRTQIRKLLKKYPAYPDLRALNAIQIFNDASQSGLDAKKIKVIQGSLREITRAMYNGGTSLFNINWFIKIYVRYIDALRDKYLHEYNACKNHFSKGIRSMAEDIHRKHLQLTVMASVKSKLSGLTLLNAKLKGSIYTVTSISNEEVKKACLAIKSEDGSRKVGEGGKTANNIIYIIMTINLLFARIPILDNLVKSYQRSIPDISRDIILQKVMVNNMRRVRDFQLSMAGGDLNESHDVANKMYLDNLDIIKQHLDHAILTKQYEVDPFLKAAWVIKESTGFFKEDEYKRRLESALKLIEVIFSKRVQVKSAHDLAKNLQDEIHYIMIENGWMK
ncbi:hypothetical protein KJ966_10500 [bacterium]|nr:hypothetical protein [bacterium]